MRVGVIIDLIVAVSISERVTHQRYRSYFDVVASGIADVDDAGSFWKIAAGLDDEPAPLVAGA